MHGGLCLDACFHRGLRPSRPAPGDRAGERTDPELAEGPRRLDYSWRGPFPRRSLERCYRALESSAAALGPFTAVDGLFPAMAYWQLGKGEKWPRMVLEGLTVGGDSQSADQARTRALPIGGLPPAGHLGPEAALEGRRLTLNQVQSEADRSREAQKPWFRRAIRERCSWSRNSHRFDIPEPYRRGRANSVQIQLSRMSFRTNTSSFSAVALCLEPRRFTALRGGLNRGALEADSYVC